RLMNMPTNRGTEPGPALAETGIAERIATIAWPAVTDELHMRGSAVIERMLTPDLCRDLALSYPDDTLFRSRVVMERHGYGRGEYRYFAYPLPAVVAQLRAALYPHLVGVANHWNEMLGNPLRYPEQHVDFLARCHAAGQLKPTPLLLQYGAGDYNCLHQDLYGDHVFPLQVAILLSAPGTEFTGGEFIITEQRPRM